MLEHEGVHTADVFAGQERAAEYTEQPAPATNTASSSPVDLGAGDIAIEAELKAKLERQVRLPVLVPVRVIRALYDKSGTVLGLAASPRAWYTCS